MYHSLSEYGCITNTRTFAETAALYQEDMTSAFSGGLVYEYSQEGNGYGLVTISGNSVTPVGQQFSDLKQQMTSTPDPSNGGNYSTTGVVQDCPPQGEDWDTTPFTGSALPALPSAAQQYYSKGAGKGPGLSGDGSQNAGTTNVATAAAGAGSVTATMGSGAASTGGSGTSSSGSASASSSKGAAAGRQMGDVNMGSLVSCVVMLVGVAVGATLL